MYQGVDLKLEGKRGESVDPSIAAGYNWLEANAKAAWDFTQMTGISFGPINEESVADFTGNGYDAIKTGGFVPSIFKVLTPKGNLISALFTSNPGATSKSGFITATPPSLFYRTSFEIHILLVLGDGFAGNWIWGVNNGATRRLFLQQSTSGVLEFSVNVSGTTYPIFRTNSAFFVDNTNDPTYLRVTCDFENDIARVFRNGIEIPTTNVGTAALSTQNPASFTQTIGEGIGFVRNSASNNQQDGAGAKYIFKAAITPLLPANQVANVGAWMTNIES